MTTQQYNMTSEGFNPTTQSTSIMNSSSNDTNTCTPVFRNDLIFYIILVGIEIFGNILVLWAIVTNRKKLRRNFVYSYVASLVVANIALGLNTFLLVLNFLYPLERPINEYHIHEYDRSNEAHIQIMNWWAFRKALMLGLFLVMSGSVMALISGIMQSASFVGRAATVAGSKIHLQKRRSSLSMTESAVCTLSRRQTAIITIFLVWLIPLIFTLLTYAWSGCINYCSCLPAYYAKEHFCSVETGPNANNCSNVWVPLSNSYILLAVCMWTAQSIAIFVFLGKAISKYNETMKPVKVSYIPPSSVSVNSNHDINKNEPSIQQTNSETQEQNDKLSSSGNIFRNKNLRHSSYKKPMHPTIKLLIALSISYTICTAPTMICFFIDTLSADRFIVSDIAVTVSSIILFAYGLVCPGFLVAYMPGLRNSLIKLLLPCSCTTTTVVNRMVRLATVKKRSNTNEIRDGKN